MSRHLARELALKVLYQHDLVGSDPLEAMDHICAEEAVDPESREFARELVAGVLQHRGDIDGRIAAYARDWRLERIAPVDRNILRLAICEILYRPDVPAGVAINEAVELAKAYGEEDSSRFVNGILGQLTKDQVEAPAAGAPNGAVDSTQATDGAVEGGARHRGGDH